MCTAHAWRLVEERLVVDILVEVLVALAGEHRAAPLLHHRQRAWARTEVDHARVEVLPRARPPPFGVGRVVCGGYGVCGACGACRGCRGCSACGVCPPSSSVVTRTSARAIREASCTGGAAACDHVIQRCQWPLSHTTSRSEMSTEKPANSSSQRNATLTKPISRKSESWCLKYLPRAAAASGGGRQLLE